MLQRLAMKICAAVALLLGASGIQADEASDRAAVARVYQSYAEIWRRNDATVPTGIMDLFTDDAVIMPHHGDPRRDGKAAIADFWFPGGQVYGRVDRYTQTVEGVYINGDAAHIYGRFDLKFTFNGMVTENGGNQMAVMRRTDTGWKMAALIWNDPFPKPRPAGVMERLAELCGQAFQGKVLLGPEDDPWRSAKLIMHVRDCSEKQLKIPLHYDDDRSRIWVVSRVDAGLSLKHDHRHEDGSEDDVTQYGGVTLSGDGAWGDRDVAFPADAQTVALFTDKGMDRSTGNLWHMALDGDTFIYRLTRADGSDFQVGFDLTAPIKPPPPAWDKADEGA